MEETYHWITDYLIHNAFRLSVFQNEIDMERETLMNWLDLPSVMSVVSEAQVLSIRDLFYAKASSCLDSASSIAVMDVKQFHLGKCASILKGISLLYQNAEVFQKQDNTSWIALCEKAMALSCNARDDCISVSQLWVLLSFPLLKSAAEYVERTEQLKERVRAGTQLRLMLTRQLLLYLPFPSLRELHDGETVRALQEEVETITINTVDESVSQAEVMGLFLSCYVNAHMEIPPSCADATLSLVIRYLDSSARKLTKASEDVLSYLIQSASVRLRAFPHV